ncbi:kinase-regulated stress-responsive transcription factor skn7 [Haplosporangium sp. Z 27]|nr:kinase-regulated stress-responsive transcription factor skn7 [Haplosporangium sp. Z 27]
MCQDPSLESPVFSLSQLTVKKQDDWIKPQKGPIKVAPRQQQQSTSVHGAQHHQSQHSQSQLQHNHQQQMQHHEPLQHQQFQRSQQQQHQQQFISSTSISDQDERVQQNNSVGVPSWSMPPKVLLVEDDDICRHFSSRLLQIFGCPFDVAEDGLAAVGKMSNQKYDIVLMDIMMPKLDGVSATTQIRQFDAMTPIISMTSNTTDHNIKTYFENGMNDILPKPFTKSSLLSMLEKHCQHLRYLKLGSNLLEVTSGASESNSNGQENRLMLTNRQGDSADAEAVGFSLTTFQGHGNLQLVSTGRNGISGHQNQQDNQSESMENLGMGLQLGLSNMLIINGADSSMADATDDHSSGNMHMYSRQNHQDGLKQGIDGNEGDHTAQSNYGINSMNYIEMMESISRDGSPSSSLSPDQTHIQLNGHHSHSQQYHQQPLHQSMHNHNHQSHSHHMPTPPNSVNSSISPSRYTPNMNGQDSYSSASSSSMMAAYPTELDSPYSHSQSHQQHQQHHGSITLLSIRSDNGMAHTLGLMNRGVDFNGGLGLGNGMDHAEGMDTQTRRKRTKIEEIE